MYFKQKKKSTKKKNILGGYEMAEVMDRVHYIWNNVLRDRDRAGVSLDRAKLVTESWQSSTGYPQSIRRGMAIEHMLSNIPLFIDDEQLFCGSYSSHSMWGEWYPEYECKFLLGDANNEPALERMSKDMADLDEIRRIAEFWAAFSMEDQFMNYMTAEEVDLLTKRGETGSFAFIVNGNRARHGGYYCLNIEKVVKKGLRGVIQEIDDQLANLRIMDHETLKRSQNLRGWRHALQGGINYGHRCAALCREKAETAPNAERKAELLEMARVCDWVPENPARTFHEALQTTYFVQIFTYLESRGDGVSPGRVDQYCYDCYKSDVEKGNMTREKAIELINCFRVKFNTFRQLSSKAFMNNTSGEAQFHNITLGGTDGQGNCAVNELSYLFLEASMQLRMPHPTMSIRYFDGIPKDFLEKALEVVSLGCGYPAFYNDKSHIPMLIRYGIKPEDANNYAIGGCVQSLVPGKTAPGYPVFINMAKCLELALYDGVDEYRGGHFVGAHTGRFEDFKTFDEFYDAVKAQFICLTDAAVRYCNIQRSIRDDLASCGYADALIDGAIESGLTCSGAGAQYNMQYVNPMNIIDTADSLTAVKKCVFEDKTVAPETLIAALKANFEGYEDVRKILQAAPKYGNDNDYADNIAKDLYHWFAETVNERFEAGFGTHYRPGGYSVSTHTPTGACTGALPDGRLAGVALADGSVSPCQGADTCGPTAVLNSAGKIDQYELVQTLLNMKFQGSMLKDPADRVKLAALIKSYFDEGGKHIQFNVVSRDALEDAQVAPERHRDLIVRVAGYSAFFVELVPNLQNEIISRTENTI